MSHSSRSSINRRTFLRRAAAGSGALAASTFGAVQTPSPPEPQNINVRSAPYNAVGDGVADDRPAIQAALDDAERAGGTWVYLPAGTYVIGGTLILRDRANLTGAGPFSATIHWAGRNGDPVLSDESFGKDGQSAFGRIILSHFGVNGNGANGAASDGVATTAYYSTFENLYISGCAGDGLRFGFEGLRNYASQNLITGCRVADCGGAAIHLGIHAVDTSITECFLHDCQTGILLQNGGHRVENNDIFGHSDAAIALTQTVSNVIISGNDLNANRREAITVTRTSLGSGEAWGQVVIMGNAIVEDGLEADNTYDAIRVDTNVPDGIRALTIIDNKIGLGNGPNQYRYGINLFRNVAGAYCNGNHIVSVGTARYLIGPSCRDIAIDSLGPVALNAPPLPPSGQPLQNPFHAPVLVYVSGGQVSSAGIGGVSFGFSGGALRLRPGEVISLQYSRAPAWTWIPE